VSTQVLLRTSALGDIVLAAAAARFLTGAGHRVVWVVGRRWHELAPALPAAATVTIGGPTALLALARRLRGQHPDCVHDLQGKLLSRALTWAIGTRHTRYDKRDWHETWAAARGVYPLRPADSRPVWRRYLDTVGAPADLVADGRLLVRDPERQQARDLLARFNLRPGEFVLLHPGASHPGKCLPPAAFARLATIRKDIVLIGDAADSRYPAPGADLRGQVPLSLLAAVISQAAGVITSDSGPMHVAAATGRPLAAIFLQTDPCLGFSPVPNAAILTISRELPCKPCHLHGARHTCPIETDAGIPPAHDARRGAGAQRAEQAARNAVSGSANDPWACHDLDWDAAAEQVRQHLARSRTLPW